MTNVDTVPIDRNGTEGQSSEFETLSRQWKARIFDPGRLAFHAEYPEREAESGVESAGNDDLGQRAIDAARNREVAGDLAPKLKLTAWIRIYGRHAHFSADGLGTDARNERCRTCLCRGNAH